MIRKFFIYALFTFIASSVFSQAVIKNNKQPVNQRNQQQRIDLNNRIMFARQLIKDRNYEGAAAFLETLYEESPSNEIIMSLMRQCYNQLNQYDKIEELLKRFIELYPKNYTNHIAYAQNLVRLGKTEEALKAYDKSITLVKDFNAVKIQIILQSMISNDFDETALKLINHWRDQTMDPLLFAIQSGSIYEKQKEYLPASKEYYMLLKDTTQNNHMAEQKYRALLEFIDSQPVAEKYLKDQTDLFTNNRALNLLSNYYLRSNQFEKAFSLTIVQDSVAGYPGMHLISYMRKCINGKYYNQAVRMGDYLLNDYPNKKSTIRAYFLYADALTKVGQYEKACENYKTAYEIFPSNREKADALYKIGEIYLYHTFEYEKALKHFDSVVKNHRTGLSFVKAIIKIPYCYLYSGDFDTAYDKFNKIYQTPNNENIKEEALYNLGLINFYNKKIDSTEAAFNKLLVEFPRGFFVNDVMKLITIIDDAKNFPELLYEYSNALLFEQRRKSDSTIYHLNLLVKNNNKLLADIALFKIGMTELSNLDTAKAVEYFDIIISEYPESYYLPFSMKTKADIALNSNRIDDASELYIHLLKNYPNYPFITEIRDKLRLLEESRGSA